MIKEFNIFIAGVGGQGVILASELLGKAAVADGLKLTGSEILGMAVRGGAVFSTIRLGSEVYGPLIPEGRGDLMIGMEAAETLRNITYMSKSSFVLVNTQKMVPPIVLVGRSNYPGIEQILKKLREYTNKVIQLEAVRLAKEAGSVLAANIVMLGASFGTEQIPIKLETIKETIKGHFAAESVPINLKAFDLGYEACQQAIG